MSFKPTAAIEIAPDLEDAINQIANTQPLDLWLRAKTAFFDFAPRLVGALLLLVIAHVVIKGTLSLLKKFLKASKIDATMHSFILGSYKYLNWIIVIVIALLVLRVPASPLVAVLGSLGLALSLALRDSLTNLAGGMYILFNRPFLKGDLIEVKGAVGSVRAIELFYTRIVTDDDKTVYLPNGDAAKSVVTNYSTEPLTRVDLIFSLGQALSFEKAGESIHAVLKESPYTLKEPPPYLSVRGESSHRCVSVKVWAKSAYYEKAVSELTEEIESCLKEL